jgi:CobQ-like glutamine amidotransferase family enzyme
MVTTKGTGARAVGEVVAEPDPDGPVVLPTLTGFENHGGQTALATDATGNGTAAGAGRGTTPLARVRHGVGNGDGSGTEGAVRGRVIGTYLHGPVLARNPALADLLLAWALDVEPASLAPLDDTAAEALRQERFAATTPRRRRGRRRTRVG